MLKVGRLVKQEGEARAKPFLRWAGSKRAMLPQLREHIPDKFNKYIEPFAGSACFFFDIQPKSAVISDLNERLIATYRTVSARPIEVAAHLAGLPTGSDAYYKIRASYSDAKSATERAATFIYLNRFCFNGLFRTNREGRFNVPYGAPRSAAVPGRDELRIAAKAIRKAELCSGDFESIVLRHAKSDDFVYLDPPFHTTGTRVFTQYNAKPFAGDDFERLVSLLEEIDRRGSKFLLSYVYSADAMKAFAAYKLKSVVTRRNISGFPQHRGAVRELIVRNYSN